MFKHIRRSFSIKYFVGEDDLVHAKFIFFPNYQAIVHDRKLGTVLKLAAQSIAKGEKE